MPQVIRVLCCVKCKMFQVDIVKNSKKWQCKLCGEKQSAVKEYCRGSGAECRQIVQELNLITNSNQANSENVFLNHKGRNDLDFGYIAKQERVHKAELFHGSQINTTNTENKWAKYLRDIQ